MLLGRIAVVGLRVRRLGFCDPNSWKLSEYSVCNWPQIDSGNKEMLVLPTGSGAILYRPMFFHEGVFDPHLRELTATNDDLAFRLITLARGIPVVAGCCDTKHPCWIPEGEVAGLVSPYPTPAPISLADTQRVRLWQANRESNRNGKMWMNSVIYLESKGFLNFTKILYQFLDQERSYCFRSKSNEPEYECAVTKECPISQE